MESTESRDHRRVAFVTNFCPHYRRRTFELLAAERDVRYYFFSPGHEWYWMPEHELGSGDFRSTNLPGFSLFGTRIAPSLPWIILRGRFRAVIKCINGRFALPATYLVCRLTGTPFILWTGIWNRLAGRGHKLLFPFTRYIYRHADAIVTYGDHVRHYLLQEGVAPERVFVAHHAIDNEVYVREVSEEEKEQLRQRLDLQRSDRIVLYVGRLEPSKGIEFLLHAVAELERTDVKLVLVGTGSLEASLIDLARRLGIEGSLRLAGYVKPAETVGCYSIADVLVLPSITLPSGKEPWGLVVNEAFNQGVPVIATDAVGAAAGGLVTDGETGFVVAERESAQLARALARVLDSSELRERLSREARRRIASWDNRRMVQGFLDAIDFVTRTAPAARVAARSRGRVR